jgi:DNA-binding LacI/PurR family transcriptional regulator
MRGAPSVSEARREAVLRAARELGYRPNELARGLVQRRTRTFGVLLSDLRNPFFAEAIEGIKEEAGAARYRTLLNTGDREPEREVEAISTLLERQTDGVILLSPRITEEALEDVARSAPTVLVGRLAESHAGLDCVVNDDPAGATMAVEHLAGLGHRRIAHVTGGNGAGAADRRRGYERAMTRLGLGEHISVAEGDYTEAGGYEGAKELLSRRPLPTAIFAANDLAALGTLSALEEAGVSVPGDVSLVGYDNTNLAALGQISLTSIDQPRHRMGVLAAQLLLERVESGRTTPRREVLKPRLVARGSSAPPGG